MPGLTVALSLALLPFSGSDTLRLQVGAREVDGRVYAPHAARVRVYVGPGEGRMRAEWTNVLTVGDSAGRRVMRWVTTGTQYPLNGDPVRWELRQTYDAQTLAPYGIVRTASTGLVSSLRIDGTRVRAPAVPRQPRRKNRSATRSTRRALSRPRRTWFPLLLVSGKDASSSRPCGVPR